MIGVVLAAGRGKRLWPITDTRPKVLAPVGGRPIILGALELLSRLGIRKAVIVTHYMKESVIEYVKTVAPSLNLDPVFVDQGEEGGTAHALEKALDAAFDDALVVYGDLYLDVDGVARALEHAVRRRINVVAAVWVRESSRYGRLVIDGERVLRVEEKPPEGGPALVNAGIYFISGEALRLVDEIEPSVRGERELTDIVGLARARGLEFKFVELGAEQWKDVGYPWDLLEANKLALQKIRERAIIGEVGRGVEIRGPVVVDEGAQVKGCTYIEGPAYIGRGAVVGPNAYVRPYTAILEGAHVGFSVEVKESIVMERAHAAHLSYIGDSVICENVNLGAGTLLANLRLDEREVVIHGDDRVLSTGRRKLGATVGGCSRLGVGVRVMPGVRIGSRAIIYPGVTVYRDVPSGAVVERDWR